MARELENFLACRDAWPTYAEFRAHGHRRLFQELNARGGPERWALELGVVHPRRRPGPAGYTERRVRHELRQALRTPAPVDVWPDVAQLRAAGSAGLIEALQRTGGQTRWAAEFGVPLPGRRARWGEEHLERELRAFLAGRDTWPAQRTFVAAGRVGLLRAAQRHGGVAWWARRLGVTATCRRRDGQQATA